MGIALTAAVSNSMQLRTAIDVTLGVGFNSEPCLSAIASGPLEDRDDPSQ